MDLWDGNQVLKSVVDGIVVTLEAKKINGHVRQGEKNNKPFSAGAGWLACFKGDIA